MKTKGKSINLYLLDGTVNGCVKCSLMNWTGVAYKIPRTELDRCKDRSDLKQSGVYFLFGTSDDSGNDVVYIGQAGSRKNGEGILYRLQEHKRNQAKGYWTEAVVFTTSNNALGPTEISFLENRFYNLAKEAKRYEVKNENDPTLGNITEEKESELEEFIDNAEVIMGALGHKVFIPFDENPSQNNGQKEETSELGVFKLKSKNALGIGRRTSEGFVLVEGSLINPSVVNSCPKTTLKSRAKYAGLIDKNNKLTKTILLSSPSAAASFVTGTSINGMITWKNEAGLSLKELELLATG